MTINAVSVESILRYMCSGCSLSASNGNIPACGTPCSDYKAVLFLPRLDVIPVVHCVNTTTAHPSDEFRCSACGFHMTDYSRIEDENDYYEYTPKFCPECGAKVEEFE